MSRLATKDHLHWLRLHQHHLQQHADTNVGLQPQSLDSPDTGSPDDYQMTSGEQNSLLSLKEALGESRATKDSKSQDHLRNRHSTGNLRPMLHWKAPP